MAVLKILFLLALILFSRPSFGMEIPSLLSGAGATLSSSFAPGGIYTLGAAGTLRWGDPSDLSNNNSDVHFNYTSDVSPADPTDPNSPLKPAQNWGGGALIHVWEGGSIGVDLDQLMDEFEQLQTNGQTITLGVDPFRLSYRFSRNSLNSGVSLGPGATGVLMYQNALKLVYYLQATERSRFSFDGSYSFFNPPAPGFGTLLSAARLATFSDFQDTLQSFEEWRVGGDWLDLWTDAIDSTVTAHAAHEIINANLLIDTIISLGYQLSRGLHAQIDWEYTHDSTETLNTVGLELRWSWSAE